MTLTFSVCTFSQPADTLPDISGAYEPPGVAPVSGTEFTSPKTPDGIFETFFALAAFIPIAVQFLRKLIIPGVSGLWVQIFSWAIGLGITMLGWAFGLGFLSGLMWQQALMYGAGACLAANGIFDTGLIESVFSLFTKKFS